MDERRGWRDGHDIAACIPEATGLISRATTMSPIMPTVGHCPVLARGYLCRSRAKRWPISRPTSSPASVDIDGRRTDV